MSVNRSDCNKIEIDYIYEAVCPGCKEYIIIGTMSEEKEIKYCPHCGKNLREDEILQRIKNIFDDDDATTTLKLDSTLISSKDVIGTHYDYSPYSEFFRL